MGRLERSISESASCYLTVDKKKNNLMTYYPKNYLEVLKNRFRYYVKEVDYKFFELKDGRVYNYWNGEEEKDYYY